MAKKSSRKPARKAAKSRKAPARKSSRPAAKSAQPKKNAMAARRIRPGFITHTELASNDPAATKAWASEVFGWKIQSMPMPQGDYHMWSFGDNQGGGIRGVSGPESPGTVPYVEVKDLKAAFDKAVRAGATAMMPPAAIPGGNGAMAIVQAPGGPAVGFWSDKL